MFISNVKVANLDRLTKIVYRTLQVSQAKNVTGSSVGQQVGGNLQLGGLGI